MHFCLFLKNVSCAHYCFQSSSSFLALDLLIKSINPCCVNNQFFFLNSKISEEDFFHQRILFNVLPSSSQLSKKKFTVIYQVFINQKKKENSYLEDNFNMGRWCGISIDLGIHLRINAVCTERKKKFSIYFLQKQMRTTYFGYSFKDDDRCIHSA